MQHHTKYQDPDFEYAQIQDVDMLSAAKTP